MKIGVRFFAHLCVFYESKLYRTTVRQQIYFCKICSNFPKSAGVQIVCLYTETTVFNKKIQKNPFLFLTQLDICDKIINCTLGFKFRKIILKAFRIIKTETRFLYVQTRYYLLNFTLSLYVL